MSCAELRATGKRQRMAACRDIGAWGDRQSARRAASIKLGGFVFHDGPLELVAADTDLETGIVFP